MNGSQLRVERIHLWRGDRHVLRGVSCEVDAGSFLQITGANGAGKTTLIRALVGLIRPESGKVIWNGVDTTLDPAVFHRDLAYLGHDSALKAELTGAENLSFNIGLRRNINITSITDTLAKVQALSFADRAVRTLSAGQRRRIALAGLLLAAVPVWILDEPATNLDAAGHALMGELIDEQLAAGGLVIAAVHQPLATRSSRVAQLHLDSS